MLPSFSVPTVARHAPSEVLVGHLLGVGIGLHERIEHIAEQNRIGGEPFDQLAVHDFEQIHVEQ